MNRHPAVAGHFYPGSRDALREQVKGFIVPAARKAKALGVMVPHAGLIYSGAVAGAVYSGIELPDTFVLIGPNHTGLGAPVSIMTSGTWETPLGAVGIDTELATTIQSKSRRFQEDPLAHLREHSLEVQLPFIQYLKEHFTIVPIQLLDTRLATCQEVGRAIAEAIREWQDKAAGRRALVVASSDMSHYEPADTARAKDEKAIERILHLDPAGLHHTVMDSGITMCGYGPAAAMLFACKELGATGAELVKYTNSGDVSGDFDQVVGYAGVVVS
jgi:AmmeMemoRadiSam system protein B